jgi:hypothetical protein
MVNILQDIKYSLESNFVKQYKNKLNSEASNFPSTVYGRGQGEGKTTTSLEQSLPRVLA